MKILVADDERHIVRFVEYNLKLSGYDVITAYSGRDAIRALAEERPDAMILDIHMPGANGLEVLRRVRDNAETADLPVIIFTAHLMDRTPEEIASARPNIALPKPIAPTRLIGALEELGVTPTRPTETESDK